MSKPPVEILLDSVDWQEIDPPSDDPDGIPYATHEGVLTIGDMSLRCYRLNTGQAVFHADDLEQFFGALLDEVPA